MCTQVLFPAYLFVNTYAPRLFYEELENINIFIKLLAEMDKEDNDSFYPIEIEQQIFLEDTIDKGNMVRLTLIERNRNNQIYIAEGPLLYYENDVMCFDYRHRRTIAELSFKYERKRV